MHDPILHDEDQILLNNARDPNKLQVIRNRLRQHDGGIYNGSLPESSWSKKYLGDMYQKVVLATPDIETFGTPNNEFTVLGGWCAIRTKCNLDMAKGIITDPLSGNRTNYNSVTQVAEWIQRAVSADQIVETIGTYTGDIYAAISEEQLWTEKVINAVEQHLKKRLTDHEKELLDHSIGIAETKRYTITKNYLEYVTGKSINLTRIIDKDIYNNIVSERNKLLEIVGTTIDDLVKPILNRAKTKSKIIDEIAMQETLKDLYHYIDSYSLVWLMYTGAYLNILKSKGFIKTPKAIIIEPWSHAFSNEARAVFNANIFKGANNYSQAKGLNEDLAFVGIDEASKFNWKQNSATQPISMVPNISNLDQYFNMLDNNLSISSIDLRINESFINGVNYLPYGKCKQILIQMIALRDEYRKDRQKHKHDPKYLGKLRTDTSSTMKSLANSVNNELYTMFKSIFQAKLPEVYSAGSSSHIV
jgi:hypothetical protein